VTVLDQLRAVVVVTTLAGVAALALSGLTPGGIAALAAAAVAAGAAASRRYPSPAGVRARQGAALAVLVAVIVGVQPYVDRPRVAIVPLSLGVAVVSSMLLDTVRDHVRAAALAVSLVLLAVATAPAPRLAVPFTLAWLGALVAVVLVGHVPPADPRWTIAQTPAGRARVAPRRAGATVGLALVTGLVAFLLVPPPEQWQQQRRLEEQRRAAGQQAGGRSASAYSSGTLDMRIRGRLSEQPVLSVAPGAPALWRTGALGSYDGARWFTTLSQGPRRLSGPEVNLQTPGDAVPPAVEAAEADVRPLARYFSEMVSPGRPLSVRTSHDVIVRGDSIEFVQGSADRVAPYAVRYAPPAAAPAGVPVAATSASVWTQLPPALPARVRALAEDTAGRAPDRASAVAAVERYLAENATYRLDSRVPAPGEDAVDAFLFTDRTGFCEQFAAAEVVLLRSVGVPARMAVGFAGGDAVGSGRRLLRERHAHAWVEVWYPDVGWVASDPTAGAVLADDSRGVLDRVTDAVQRLLSSARARLAAALALVAVAVLGGLLLRRRGARGVRRVANGREAAARAGAVIDAYRRLEVALHAVGTPRAPAESLRELAVRVPTDRSPHPLEVVERTCYAPVDVPASEALTAAAELDRISTALLAAREESRSGAR
jgi:transglutaminase-like putative cysteine protease